MIAKEQLHVLASLISNVVIVPVGPQDNCAYLSSVGRRTNLPNSYNRKNRDNKSGSKIASLLCLLPNLGQKGEFIKDETDKLMAKF